MSRVGHAVKRSFDMVLSGLLLLVFSPLAAICALAVKLEDGGPAIYSQERIGRGWKPFNILKFRSMRIDAEAAGSPALYAGDDDPRLTRVGKFLRQHHLDELPQLWNVFRGDMSFIGYRPERRFYIDQIMAVNPRYQYLFQIRPGVTSYATLYNGYTDTLDKMLTRLDLDLYYLRNHSLWFDAELLAMTFLRIVGGKKF
ncbi:MAG: sugar transferase [Bacteroidales bacterium]|nr:sugar transferase [Bacteroidales bacterium]